MENGKECIWKMGRHLENAREWHYEDGREVHLKDGRGNMRNEMTAETEKGHTHTSSHAPAPTCVYIYRAGPVAEEMDILDSVLFQILETVAFVPALGEHVKADLTP